MIKYINILLSTILAFILIIGGYTAFRTYQSVQSVLVYKPIVEEILAEDDNLTNEDLVLAMIYTETKGNNADVMQSSESADEMVNTIQDDEESIRQGVDFLSENLSAAQEAGVDEWTAVQAYNFGTAYIDYVKDNGGENTLELAKQYSRDVVAPSLGNVTGETYPYNNPIAFYYNDRNLYVNGGNYYYSRLVQLNRTFIRIFS